MSRSLRVACPTCRAEVEWSDTSPWRPFCSARCKGIDLGDWASNRFVIADRESAGLKDNIASTTGDPAQ